MPVVWNDRCRLHDPGGEIFVGVRTAGTEVAARTDAILASLSQADAQVVDAEQHADSALLAVHDAALLKFLESAWDDWIDAELDRERGQDRVVPYVFAHAGLTSGRPAAVPAAAIGRRLRDSPGSASEMRRHIATRKVIRASPASRSKKAVARWPACSLWPV
jgi:hypothetical protein